MLVTLENSQDSTVGDVIIGCANGEDIGLGIVIEISGFYECVHVEWLQSLGQSATSGRVCARLYDRGAL